MPLNRRDFFKTAGLVGAAAVGMNTRSAEASEGHGPPISQDTMGVLVDVPKCIGCRRCEFACQDAQGFEHLPIETYEDKSIMEQHRRPAPDRYTTINQFPNPDSPDPQDDKHWLYTKVNCFHCNDPACMSACIVSAFSKRKDGSVIYDPGKCMGCRYCMVACPFQIPAYDYHDTLTPQVRKCNFCAHKIPDIGEAGDEKQNWTVPSCVKICPQEVLIYGKRHELLELAHEKIRREPDLYVDHIYGEHEVGGTSWMYLSSVPFEDLIIDDGRLHEPAFIDLPHQAPPRLTEMIQHGEFKFFIPPLAWYGILGAIMYLAKPKPEGDSSGKAGH